MQEVVRMPEDELAAYRALPMWNKRVQLAPTIPRELVIDRTYEFRDDRFSGLGVPVALLLGGESPPLFQRAIQKLDSALSTSTVVKLPGQQHVAMDTNADLFIETVLSLLLE